MNLSRWLVAAVAVFVSVVATASALVATPEHGYDPTPDVEGRYDLSTNPSWNSGAVPVSIARVLASTVMARTIVSADTDETGHLQPVPATMEAIRYGYDGTIEKYAAAGNDAPSADVDMPSLALGGVEPHRSGASRASSRELLALPPHRRDGSVSRYDVVWVGAVNISNIDHAGWVVPERWVHPVTGDITHSGGGGMEFIILGGCAVVMNCQIWMPAFDYLPIWPK